MKMITMVMVIKMMMMMVTMVMMKKKKNYILTINFARLGWWRLKTGTLVDCLSECNENDLTSSIMSLFQSSGRKLGQ